MRFAFLAGALVWFGCHAVLPLADGQDLRVVDARPGDGAGEGVVPTDLPLDAGPAPTLTFSAPASLDLPIGRHQLLAMSASPPGSISVRLTARPCLLKREGQGAGPVGELDVDLPGSGGLVVFAPPAAPPGATCTLAAAGTGQIQPLTFTVKAPGYVVTTLPDHAIDVIEGMTATTVGKLSGAFQAVQGLTYADGAFGGTWVAITGAKGDNPVSTSTVTVYKFAVGTTGDVAPWVDLTGKADSPTAVEDMVWSPAGPCQSPEALYVAGPAADAAGTGGQPGGVYCLDAGGKWEAILDGPARTLDVDVDGIFEPARGKGTLYVSKWGGHYVYPGSTFSDPAVPSVAQKLRFGRAGPQKGHLHVIASGGPPYTLTRVTPTPHMAVPLADLNDANATIAMSHGGAFGELLVVADESTDYARYTLTALIEEPGLVRELDLARHLQCARRVAFDSSGLRLAVITAGISSSCVGTSTVHLLGFPLP